MPAVNARGEPSRVQGVRSRRTKPKKERTGCGTKENNRVWLNIEPSGAICATLTWVIATYGQHVVANVVIWPWLGGGVLGWTNLLFLRTIYVLAMAAHLRTMLSNPGAVPEAAKPTSWEHRHRRCARCQNGFKPPRAHHCSLCRRCIIKMDHHCPWVNNCVGLCNQKFFLQFVMYTCFLSVLCVVYITLRSFFCLGVRAPRAYQEEETVEEAVPRSLAAYESSWCPRAAFLSAGGSMAIASVLVLSILFGLFTLGMSFEQIRSITENLTAIDRLKGEDAKRGGKAAIWVNLAEVFGGDPNDKIQWHWFFPTSIRYLDAEDITGYTLRHIPLVRQQNQVLDQDIIDASV